jgi:hypothetical protein
MAGFSPVATIIGEIYGISEVIVESQMIIFVFMFIPSNFLVIYMLNKWGLRWTLVIGAIFILTGSWIRILIKLTEGFLIVSLGSVFAAFG